MHPSDPSLTAQPPARADGRHPATDRRGREAVRFWNRVARRYAADPIADPAGYERTLERVRGLLQPGDSALEVGCGTGTTALRLAPHAGRWRATDASPAMIAIAREKLAAIPSPPRLRFGVADAAASAREGQRPYDIVLAFNLLHLVDDLDGTIAALAAALKPGGLLVAKTACVAELGPLVTRLALPLMRALGQAPPVRVFDAATLCAAFERQGLALDAVERHGTPGGRGLRKDIRVFVVARKPAV